MFFLICFGVYAIIGAWVWLMAVGFFLNARAQKRHLLAALLALPVFGLVFLVIAGIMYVYGYGNSQAETAPDAVFKAVFGTPPTSDVRALRAYRDEDELSPAFLNFQAPPKVVAQLTGGKYTLLSSVEKATLSISDYHWNNPPGWFSTQVTAQTQVFRLKNTVPESNYLLFYEPRNKTVRVYFEAIGVHRFWK